MKFNKTHFIIVIGAIGVVLFFYYNRHHELTHAIQAYGSTGRVAAILMMTLIFLTPIPSEGLLLIYFNVYGVFMGLVYAWTSYVISVVLLFLGARYLLTTFIQKTINPSRFETVEKWLNEKGVLGLLIVRMLPIPAFIVNCVMGAMPSVRFSLYFVTAIVAIIPYYVSSSLLYLGISTYNYKIALIAIPILLGAWLITRKIKQMNHDKNKT